MMNFDATKNTVTGIVDVNNTTITVGKFELSSGSSATQALQELSERAVRDYKSLDVKWVDCKQAYNKHVMSTTNN